MSLTPYLRTTLPFRRRPFVPELARFDRLFRSISVLSARFWARNGENYAESA